jgi:hypothetical protein
MDAYQLSNGLKQFNRQRPYPNNVSNRCLGLAFDMGYADLNGVFFPAAVHAGGAEVQTSDQSDQPPVRPLRVIERSSYRGANLYSLRAMVRIRVDIGALEGRPSNTLPDFSRRLLTLLPGLRNHHCSKGRPGGLVERLETGTWFGHIVEHVAIELQSLAGARVSRGKTRSVFGQPGIYDILYEYTDEQAALLAGAHALGLLTRLLPENLAVLEGLGHLPRSNLAADASIAEIVAELMKIIKASAFGPSTQAIVDARDAVAFRSGVSIRRASYSWAMAVARSECAPVSQAKLRMLQWKSRAISN